MVTLVTSPEPLSPVESVAEPSSQDPAFQRPPVARLCPYLLGFLRVQVPVVLLQVHDEPGLEAWTAECDIQPVAFGLLYRCDEVDMGIDVHYAPHVVEGSPFAARRAFVLGLKPQGQLNHSLRAAVVLFDYEVHARHPRIEPFEVLDLRALTFDRNQDTLALS